VALVVALVVVRGAADPSKEVSLLCMMNTV